MPNISKWLTAAVGCALVLGAVSASAATLQVVGYDGNDCPEVFGTTGFSSCSIDGSPIVIKFNAAGEVDEINSIFPSVDGSEFDFEPDLAGTLVEGEFSYTPGTDDPAIRFWVAKGGDGFNLFYIGDAGDLSTAIAITASTFYEWWTPDRVPGISHMAFYDTEGEPGEEPVTPGPEPASLALFGLALVGAGYRARRTARR